MTEIRHICDGYDCWKTDDWDEIWEIDKDVAKKIIELGFCNESATNANDLHLCEECINELLKEYPDVFEVEDEMLYLKENEK